MRHLLSILYYLAPTLLVLGVVYLYLIQAPAPRTITYGVSFNVPYTQELGLPWREVYQAILEDLQVKNLRLAAHWTLVEQREGEYDFSLLDEQMNLAHEHGATVILAVGRRLPRWPECHVPVWAKEKDWEEQKNHLRNYLRAVIDRYKQHPSLLYWQVENEPFLTIYAREQCGELDVAFLDEEIALVHSLDPYHPVLVTDSGNLGTWGGAYKRGDVFGTSVYLYLWNEHTGPVTSVLPAHFYRAKRRVMELIYGEKETVLIELSAEPWLLAPVTDVPIETQLTRMNEEKLQNALTYARETRLSPQYLWGAEWWYWLRDQGRPELWEYAHELFSTATSSTATSTAPQE